MPTTITMPQLGETVTEGTVAQWLKKPGDSIEKYESFVEVSTDKVNAEVPSPVSGVLREIICKEGETVATGAPIAIIDEVGAVASAPEAPAPPDAVLPAASHAQVARTNGSHANGAPSNGVHANSTETLRRVSPAVRRLAREHSIDLSRVHGTGHNGRITANDVIAAASDGPSAVMAATIMHAPVTAPAPAPAPAAAKAPPADGARSTYASPVPGTLVPLRTRARSSRSAWSSRSRTRRTPGRWWRSTSRTSGRGGRKPKTASRWKKATR
jgi:2-oxoisovalerate dehydrogenase E2 component (dihydrolipoyl transacylase)